MQIYSWSDKYFLYCYTESKNRSLTCVGIYSSFVFQRQGECWYICSSFTSYNKQQIPLLFRISLCACDKIDTWYIEYP